MPYAIANLRALLNRPYAEYPYLNELLHRLVNMKQFTEELSKKKLTVKVMSFAYKKGIPNGWWSVNGLRREPIPAAKMMAIIP